MRYGEYYLILPNAWALANEPLRKRIGADQTWGELNHMYPSSEEDPIGTGASEERIWFSRRINQLNILAHDNANADNIIKYNGDSGLLGYTGSGPFSDPAFYAATGYYKRAWSTRCDDTPGFGGLSGRPVSSAADNIRICRQLLGIEAAYGRFDFPWMESFDTGKETADPCTGLGMLALMQACGRLVGWKSSTGYFSDRNGFGGGTLSGGIIPITAYCLFEQLHSASWVLHDVTAVARHYISTADPSAYDRMYLLVWKQFVMPPREHWPDGFIKFIGNTEVWLWPES